MHHSLYHGRSARRRAPRGATLVELLAVIIVLVMLAAAAIPVVAPAVANRQIREASRITSAFLAGARNRAMQSGRPVGVVLERLPGLPEACVTLSYAEVPAPYSGDTIASRIAVEPTGGGPYDAQIVGFTTGDFGWMRLIRVGDTVKFGYQGHTYQLVDSGNGEVDQDPSSPNYLTFIRAPSASEPWFLRVLTAPNGTAPTSTVAVLPFQITRAPVKLAAGSVQLPAQAAIDLTCSGFDLPVAQSGGQANGLLQYSDANLFPTWSFRPVPKYVANDDRTSVVITFAPSGAIDRVWCWSNVPPDGTPTPSAEWIALRPLTPIHLMVGRRATLPTVVSPIVDPDDPNFRTFLNWQDLSHFWVSISPQTGLVATTEVAAHFVGATPYERVMQSRYFAREAARTGGRGQESEGQAPQ